MRMDLILCCLASRYCTIAIPAKLPMIDQPIVVVTLSLLAYIKSTFPSSVNL
jgi:hypothetical protein